MSDFFIDELNGYTHDREFDPNAPPSRTAVSPGKVTLTSRIPRPISTVAPSRPSANSVPSYPAPVQRRQRALEQTAPDSEMSNWDIAFRPDLYREPGADEEQVVVQRRQTGEEERGAPLASQGGGSTLPDDVRTQMEASFGADFSAVRIHEGPQAESMGALAYTQGTDIHFQPGQYDPGSQRGRELLGHELTHVVQQSHGRVKSTRLAKGIGINDDSSLEREADEMGARAARGERARLPGTEQDSGSDSGADARNTATLTNRSPQAHHTGAVQRKPAMDSAAVPDHSAASESESAGTVMLAAEHNEEGTEPAMQEPQPTSTRPVQMNGDKKRRKRSKRRPPIPIEITVTKAMTDLEFRAAALKQVFGKVIDNVIWEGTQPHYTPDKSPYTVWFGHSLLTQHRGQMNARRGFDVNRETGELQGAEDRAKEFHAAGQTTDKTALMNEIDRRYYEAAGVEPGTKIEKGDKGRAALWRQIRDEVLFQHEYIANLPPEVKALIQSSITGKELTPADYDQLFRIAKKIERMKAARIGDYKSKINASTTDLDVFEQSLDAHTAEMDRRDQDAAKQEAIKTRLLGLEEVYKLYRDYKRARTVNRVAPFVAPVVAPIVGPVTKLHEVLSGNELEEQLEAHGFSSIEEFADYIKDFEDGFEKAAATMVDDLLAKYEAKLYAESKRYQDMGQVESLHGNLGGVRTEHKAHVFHKGEAHKLERQRMRRSTQYYFPPKSKEESQHEAQATQHKEARQLEIDKLAKTNPIFQEKQLPSDKQIDKGKLASADPQGLQTLLLDHIASKISDAREARALVAEKPALIYKMDEMLPVFLAQQGLTDGSIYQQIITDKLQDDAIKNLVIGIVAAVVAIALTVVSLGTATPAIVAAGAAAGAFGLSAYMAYDELQQYLEQKDLADVGLAKDPSMVWLVVAVVGAVVDMGAAAKALRAMGPAADALKAGGEIKDFRKALQALQEAGEIDAKIATAAEKAAMARAAFKEASGDLTRALTSKTYTFPGPFADPDVYKALVKMAKAKMDQGAASITEWFHHVKQARAAAKLGELTPDELAKLKEIWQAASKLEEQVEIARGAKVTQIKGSQPWPPGVQGQAGHAKGKHLADDALSMDIINNADNVFTGWNRRGRSVTIFHCGDDVAITQADDVTRVITTYGKSTVNKVKGGKIKPGKAVDASRWADESRWKEGEFWIKVK